MRAPRIIASLAAVAALTVGTLATTSPAEAGTVYGDPTTSLPRKTSPYPGVGPKRPYVQEILINTVIPLKNQAIINRTSQGYLFRAGQQDTSLVVTHVNGRLQFVDKGTASWKWLPKACTKISVPLGVGASCKTPLWATTTNPLLLEVWPRLGDDVVDTSALTAQVDVSFLGDKGDDVAYFGAGDDFFNGAQDSDRGYGGAGRDWIRTGDAADVLDGGAEADVLVGVAGDDTMYGGSGDDRIQGLDGNDEIHAGEGKDLALCGNGSDRAYVTSTDKATLCESVSRS